MSEDALNRGARVYFDGKAAESPNLNVCELTGKVLYSHATPIFEGYILACV